MGTREYSNLPPGRSAYPARFLSVTRGPRFFVVRNLLTDARRFYADPRDVAEALRRAVGK